MTNIADKTRVFISHSSKNVNTATKLVEFLEAGLVIEPEEILCTSVVGHALSAGSSTPKDITGEN